MKRKKILSIFFILLISLVSLLFYNNQEKYCKGFLIKKCMYYVDFQGLTEDKDLSNTFTSDAEKILKKYNSEIVDIEFIDDSATAYLTKSQSKKLLGNKYVKGIVKVTPNSIRNMYP